MPRRTESTIDDGLAAASFVILLLHRRDVRDLLAVDGDESDRLRRDGRAPPSRLQLPTRRARLRLPASRRARGRPVRRRGPGTRTSRRHTSSSREADRGEGPSLTTTLRASWPRSTSSSNVGADLVLADRRREQVGIGRLRGGQRIAVDGENESPTCSPRFAEPPSSLVTRNPGSSLGVEHLGQLRRQHLGRHRQPRLGGLAPRIVQRRSADVDHGQQRSPARSKASSADTVSECPLTTCCSRSLNASMVSVGFPSNSDESHRHPAETAWPRRRCRRDERLVPSRRPDWNDGAPSPTRTRDSRR